MSAADVEIETIRTLKEEMLMVVLMEGRERERERERWREGKRKRLTTFIAATQAQPPTRSTHNYRIVNY